MGYTRFTLASFGVIAILTVTGGALAQPQYVEIERIAIADPNASRVWLTDLDGDELPELAIVENRTKLNIYSGRLCTLQRALDLDSLFNSVGVTDFIRQMSAFDVLFADVNGDSKDDLVIRGEPHSYGTLGSDRYLLGVFGDVFGSGDPGLAYFYQGKNGYYCARGVFTALDLNYDNSSEFIFSQDSLASCSPYGPRCDFTAGRTYCFNSHPGAKAWEIPRLITNLLPFTHSNGQTCLLATEDYEQITGSAYSAQETYRITNRIVLIGNDGSVLKTQSEIKPDLCQGDGWQIFSHEMRAQCVGDIDGDGVSTEVVCSYSWSQQCSDDGVFVDFQAQNWSLTMYRLDDAGNFTKQWTKDVPYPMASARYIFHPDYPGRFFSASKVYMESTIEIQEWVGISGAAIGATQTLPYGKGPNLISPADVYGTVINEPPYLVTVFSNCVSVLQFKTVTSVEDDYPTLVPTMFTLHQPYPNPFNPTVTVPITLAHKGRLRVEAFNVLGQAVGVLYDGKAGPGEMNVVWDATDVPSGVYFFKVVFDDLPKTVSAVLVK